MPRSVLVVGDLMLDEYVDGVVDRIASDAPVLVHRRQRAWHRPGGAANVARNIQHGGGRAILAGVCGADAAGGMLLGLLNDSGVNTQPVIRSKTQATVTKTRVVSDKHMLLRMDQEPDQGPEPEAYSQLIEKLRELAFDAVVISDYCKGVVTRAIILEISMLALLRNAPVVVDSRKEDYSDFSEATVVLPNRYEAARALGDASPDDAPAALIRGLRARYKLRNILLKLGAGGMVLSSEGAVEQQFFPAENLQPVDVSGAGDAVAAGVALALGAGHNLVDAAAAGSRAAAKAISSLGGPHWATTQSVTSPDREFRTVA